MIREVRKGDIYFANLNPAIGSEQKGDRPVVVIQNDMGNKYSPTTIIAPLTKVIKKEKLPTHVFMSKNEFMKYDSLVLLEQIRVIDKKRIISYLGRLNTEQMLLIDKALINTFDFDVISYLKNKGIGENYDEKKKKLYCDYYNSKIKTRYTSKGNRQKRSGKYGR